MASEHSDVAAELWALAETVLTRLEPVLRQAMEEQRERPRQGCSWCPVCALAALIRGEQHDLLTLVATEGAAVVALVRQIVADHAGTAQHAGTGQHSGTSQQSDTAHRAHSDQYAGPFGSSGTAAPAAGGVSDEGDAPHAGGPSITSDTEEHIARRPGFVPITVTVKDSAASDSGQSDSGRFDSR